MKLKISASKYTKTSTMFANVYVDGKRRKVAITTRLHQVLETCYPNGAVVSTEPSNDAKQIAIFDSHYDGWKRIIDYSNDAALLCTSGLKRFGLDKAQFIYVKAL